MLERFQQEQEERFQWKTFTIMGGFVMALKGRLEVLTKEQMKEVHEASLKILEETGVYFNYEEALDYFRKGGARVDGKMVYISRKMVEAALRTAPSIYTLKARNPRYCMEHGIGQQNRLLVSSCYGSPFVYENGVKRLGTTANYVDFTKMCQAADGVTFCGGILTDMSDAPDAYKEVCMLYQALLHSDKQVLNFTGNKRNIHHMFRLMEIAFDSGEELWKDCVCAVPICPTSPLKYEQIATESLVEYAKKGQPVCIVNCLMAGVSSPVQILGTALQQNVEFLAGLVLTQLIHPGVPTVYVAASTTANLQRVCYANGSPEANLCNIVGLQMAYYYQVPNRVMSGITDSKVPDYQAGMEVMQNHLMLVAAGAQCLHNGVGTLDSLVSMSRTKFALDAEVIDRLNCIKEGVLFNEEEMAVKEIQEVGPHGNHLTTDNTLDNYDCRWQASISYSNPLNYWEAEGRQDAAQRAEKIAREMIESQPEKIVDEKTAQKLKAYMETL